MLSCLWIYSNSANPPPRPSIAISQIIIKAHPHCLHTQPLVQHCKNLKEPSTFRFRSVRHGHGTIRCVPYYPVQCSWALNFLGDSWAFKLVVRYRDARPFIWPGTHLRKCMWYFKVENGHSHVKGRITWNFCYMHVHVFTKAMLNKAITKPPRTETDNW